MSDEKVVDVQLAERVKEGVPDAVEDGLVQHGLDGERPRRRGGSVSLPLALTGVALANGAPSRYQAAVAGGYAPSTARNPTEKGITVQRALAAAAEVFPAAPTLRTLNARGLKAIDEAFSDPAVPSMSKATLGGSVVKLHAEIGGGVDDETEPNGSALGARRLVRRGLRRAWLDGARYALTHGLDAALERAQALDARTDKRAPRLEATRPPAPRRPVSEWGRGWEP